MFVEAGCGTAESSSRIDPAGPDARRDGHLEARRAGRAAHSGLPGPRSRATSSGCRSATRPSPGSGTSASWSTSSPRRAARSSGNSRASSVPAASRSSSGRRSSARRGSSSRRSRRSARGRRAVPLLPGRGEPPAVPRARRRDARGHGPRARGALVRAPGPLHPPRRRRAQAGMKLSVVIAAYNERENVVPLTERLVADARRARRRTGRSIYVVEGTDGTREALDGIARDAHAREGPVPGRAFRPRRRLPARVRRRTPRHGRRPHDGRGPESPARGDPGSPRGARDRRRRHRRGLAFRSRQLRDGHSRSGRGRSRPR